MSHIERGVVKSYAKAVLALCYVSTINGVQNRGLAELMKGSKGHPKLVATKEFHQGKE